MVYYIYTSICALLINIIVGHLVYNFGKNKFVKNPHFFFYIYLSLYFKVVKKKKTYQKKIIVL